MEEIYVKEHSGSGELNKDLKNHLSEDKLWWIDEIGKIIVVVQCEQNQIFQVFAFFGIRQANFLFLACNFPIFSIMGPFEIFL